MMRRDQMTEGPVLLHGEIVLDEGSPPFTNASVHIYLEDTTLADASAKVVLQQVIANVTTTGVPNERIPFTLHGTIPDPQADYTVRVLIDVDGDGKLSHGDYINTTSYPVLARRHPDRVVVRVRKVR
jgi:uncharacterized lipoprotein YbaY